MFYGTAADFTTYHTDRGGVIPASWTDSVIEAALLLSSEWLDGIYADSFYGYKTGGFDQVREWPREAALTNTYPQKVFTDTEIPTRVEEAVYEAAFRELTTPGALNVDFTPNKYNKVSVSGAVSVEYAQNLSVNDSQLQILKVSSLIEPLLDPTKRGSSSKLSGSISRQ